MAGRPSKPITLVKGHRTKAEIEIRKTAEEALVTGTPLKEWKEVKVDPVAHKEFLRIRKALRSIGKDDALHENVVNRYCLIHSECRKLEAQQDKILQGVDKLEKEKEEKGRVDGMDILEYFTLLINLQKQIVALDKQLQSKRKMLLDIEKENIMTIASALRSIPKKPKNEDESPMAKFLAKKRIDNN